MSEMDNTKSSPLYGFLGILPIGVIVVFYFLSVRYSIDIPWFDDIENIPYFLINWIESATWLDKWQAVIRPNNEHRVLTARMIVLAQYITTNGLNFRVLVFCGNLSVLVLFGFLAYSYMLQKGKWYLLLPVAFFIFNFQSYASTFMTIMSMQYQMVIVLSVASFFFLAKGSKLSLFIAILLAWLDTFSMGNGMMVWPSGVVLLLYQTRWRDTLLWIIAGGTAIFFYFHGYDFVQGNDKGFAYILGHPIQTFVAFFTMLGGDFDIIPNAVFTRRMILPTITGVALFAVFVIWLLAILSVSPFWQRVLPIRIANRFAGYLKEQKDQDRHQAFWLGTFVYVFISMLLVVVFRTRFDPYIILWSTYKMYPAVLTSVVYIIIIQNCDQKYRLKTMAFFGVIAVGAWASTIFNYIPIVNEIAETRKAFAFNQKTNGIGLGATKNSAFETMAATTFEKVERLGIYSFPKPIIHADEERIDLADTTNKESVSVEVKDVSDDILSILSSSELPAHARNYVVLQSREHLYLFKIPKGTSEGRCPKGTIKSGRYSIGFWVVTEKGTKILSTGQKVNVI